MRVDRYRLYFILMDVSAAIALIALVQIALDPQALLRGIRPGFWHELVGWGSLLPLFLIFAGFMRDEYAERCWQKAAATTVRAMVLLPVVILLVAALTAPRPMSGVGGATILLWGWAMLLAVFVLAFQWHRWRGR